jgi:hypothetical protein
MLIFAYLILAHSANATLSCTAPVSTGFSMVYAATGVVPNIKQGTVSFNCTRTAAGDATSVLLTANNGAHPQGTQNRAQNGSRILYEAYKDSNCSAVWTSLVVSNFWTLNLLNVLGAQSVSVSYWGCITLANQVVSAGTYTDTVTMRVLQNTPQRQVLSPNSTFPVSITTPASLAITSPPGNLPFAYTAFGSSVNASTNFTTNGTLNLAYTMTLDANSGVVSGLKYDLQIDSQTPPVMAVGSGGAQIHTIQGNMPAGQAGTCLTGSCNASQVRTLTITY